MGFPRRVFGRAGGFAFYRGKRLALHTDVRTVLLFRNRIMHTGQ